MTLFETDLPTMATSIGRSTADDIWVQGYNLADELMGEVDFGSVFYLLITGRLPRVAIRKGCTYCWNTGTKTNRPHMP